METLPRLLKVLLHNGFKQPYRRQVYEALSFPCHTLGVIITKVYYTQNGTLIVPYFVNVDKSPLSCSEKHIERTHR